jgi:hypothetical protein
MRYIVKERLKTNRRTRNLETVGYYVLDGKRGEKVSPNYRTLSHASGHADRLEKEASK